MITASSLFADIRARLDDDNSGRYDVANDLVPAVNASIDFWVNVLNSGFESKRIVHESLADLIQAKKYTAVVYGTTAAVPLPDGEDIWTIFGVDIDAVEEGNKWIGKGRKAHRVSIAEWSWETGNPFALGSSQPQVDDFRHPIYIGIGNYMADGNKGILIRPASLLNANKDVLLWYLTNPTKIVDGASEVEFPQSMYSLILNKAVNYISFQHGGQSPYYQFTAQEVNQLATVLMT